MDQSRLEESTLMRKVVKQLKRYVNQQSSQINIIKETQLDRDPLKIPN